MGNKLVAIKNEVSATFEGVKNGETFYNIKENPQIWAKTAFVGGAALLGGAVFAAPALIVIPVAGVASLYAAAHFGRSDKYYNSGDFVERFVDNIQEKVGKRGMIARKFRRMKPLKKAEAVVTVVAVMFVAAKVFAFLGTASLVAAPLTIVIGLAATHTFVSKSLLSRLSDLIPNGSRI